MALLGILCAMAIPQFLTGVERSRAVAAARYLTHQCGAARIQAITRSTVVAIRFREHRGDYQLQMFADGNGNGIRTVEIASGVDRPLSAPESLGAHFPGVRIGLRSELAKGGDAVRVGASGLLSFTPLGTATPGSVFVLGKDGTQFAVRVLGATARTRLERWDVRLKRWVSQW